MERNNISKSNKLKLFGVELDPSQLHETDRGSTEEEGADESISSSSPSSTVTEKLLNENTPSSGERRSALPQPPTATGAKKFACSCCFKVFANPQALGGHQNAHKNEKMRLKKLQLQARNASCLNYYTTINPFSNNNFCGRESENFVNFCGSTPHLNKEVRITFGSEESDKYFEYDVNCTSGNYVSLRQINKHKFSVTDGSRPSLPESKRICITKGLDLHLGLGL